MKKVRIICIVIIWSSFLVGGISQSNSYISKLEDVFHTEQHHHDYRAMVIDAKNPVDFLFTSFYVIYKVLLSSQDMDSCVFTPSCSTYSIQSIKKYGLLIGFAATFDRLTRCHPFSGSNYSIHPANNKLYDPVD